MKPLNEMTIEELVRQAVAVDREASQTIHSGVTQQQMRIFGELLAEARRRHVAPTAWPQGDVAAEQLADAMIDAEPSIPSDGTVHYYRAMAAAVLAALAAQAHREPCRIQRNPLPVASQLPCCKRR